MPVKQVKLNLKPEIYKPLAQEAKRLRMPIAALVRVILADAILPDQDDANSLQLDEILELPLETLSAEGQQGETSTSESQIGTLFQEVKDKGSSDVLIDAARSLTDSAKSLAATVSILADSVRELVHINVAKGQVFNQSASQPVVSQPIVSQSVNQPRVDKDGELVLKLSDILAEQGAIEGRAQVRTQELVQGIAQDVIVEDLNASVESPQKLRKITINL